MDSTSVSLLRRLKRPDEESAWRRFAELYTPLIHKWALGQGLTQTDATDLVQDVMITLVVKLPEFQYDPQKSFRAWLKTVTINKSRDLLRRQASRSVKHSEAVEQTVEVASNVDIFEESEYRAYLVGQALRLMKAEFRSNTWQACWQHVAESQPAEQVAQELGMSVNAVYVAKCRVLRRLREELHGLLD